MTKLAAEPQSFATFAKGCILVVVKSTAASESYKDNGPF